MRHADRYVRIALIEDWLLRKGGSKAKLMLAIESETSPRTIDRVLAGHVPNDPTMKLIALTIGFEKDEVFPFVGKGKDAA